MPRFNVMVAYGLRIISQFVEHARRHVGLLGCHEIAVITGGLTLQHISPIEQQQPFSVACTLGFDIACSSRKTACARLSLNEIIRKKAAVNVSCVENLNCGVPAHNNEGIAVPPLYNHGELLRNLYFAASTHRVVRDAG